MLNANSTKITSFASFHFFFATLDVKDTFPSLGPNPASPGTQINASYGSFLFPSYPFGNFTRYRVGVATFVLTS